MSYQYIAPSFPGLYNFLPLDPTEAQYLIFIEDIVEFTVLWTLILYCGAHVLAALCALSMQWRSWKLLWYVPVVYVLVALLEAGLAGSVVGIV